MPATPGPVIEPALGGEPWCEVTDDDGTVAPRLADRRRRRPRAVLAELVGDSELLIADGHHRYETARTYADEVGGDGDHRYTLACLVSLEDPGLTVFATTACSTTSATRSGRRSATALREHFDLEEVERGGPRPRPRHATIAFGYMDAHHLQAVPPAAQEPGAARRGAAAAAPRPTAGSTPPSSRR